MCLQFWKSYKLSWYGACDFKSPLTSVDIVPPISKAYKVTFIPNANFKWLYMSCCL